MSNADFSRPSAADLLEHVEHQLDPDAEARRARAARLREEHDELLGAIGYLERELRGQIAQLLDQRDEALARRDEHAARLLAAQEEVGEAWLRSNGGDLARAIAAKTRALEGAIGSVDRSLDVQALEGVLDAAAVAIDAVEVVFSSIPEARAGAAALEARLSIAAYREARAALDGDCPRCGSGPLEVGEAGPYCAVCEMREASEAAARRDAELSDTPLVVTHTVGTAEQREKVLGALRALGGDGAPLPEAPDEVPC